MCCVSCKLIRKWLFLEYFTFRLPALSTFLPWPSQLRREIGPESVSQERERQKENVERKFQGYTVCNGLFRMTQYCCQNKIPKPGSWLSSLPPIRAFCSVAGAPPLLNFLRVVPFAMIAIPPQQSQQFVRFQAGKYPPITLGNRCITTSVSPSDILLHHSKLQMCDFRSANSVTLLSYRLMVYYYYSSTQTPHTHH